MRVPTRAERRGQAPGGEGKSQANKCVHHQFFFCPADHLTMRVLPRRIMNKVRTSLEMPLATITGAAVTTTRARTLDRFHAGLLCQPSVRVLRCVNTYVRASHYTLNPRKKKCTATLARRRLITSHTRCATLTISLAMRPKMHRSHGVLICTIDRTFSPLELALLPSHDCSPCSSRSLALPRPRASCFSCLPSP